MSKSLKARCIRRWEVNFQKYCDSKVNPWWRKHHLRGYIRGCALTTAECMVERLAESNAEFDYPGKSGWSPEFYAWYSERRDQYCSNAMKYLDREATTIEIDDEIGAEVDAWND